MSDVLTIGPNSTSLSLTAPSILPGARHHQAPTTTSNNPFDEWSHSITNRTSPTFIQVAEADDPINDLEVAPRQILVLGGHPGSGKTALAQQLVFDALRQPGQDELRALICNVEMPVSALLDRELARVSGVPYLQIRQRSYDDKGMDRIRPVLEHLPKILGRMKFMEPPFTAVQLMKEATNFGADLIIVDYVQRLRAEGSDARIQVSSAMESLRDIADAGRTVVAVAALNRTSYDVASHTSGSFRDSSEIEYGADAAYILERRPASSAATLKCVKRRYGEPRNLELQFDGDRQLFKRKKAEVVNDTQLLTDP